MELHFESVALADIREPVRRHLAALPAAIDSYLEDHILTAAHYRIAIAGEPAGFASIHQRTLITQFALDEPYRHFGQPVFARLRRLERVQSAFAPTSDEFFLSHALDDYRALAKQAYFFTARDTSDSTTGDRHVLRLAAPGDAELIRQESGDFFAPMEQHLAARNLFVTLRNDMPVGFGILIQSSLDEEMASIGMYTIERYRRQGIGTATIASLIDVCRQRDVRPVSGCSYYNHASKRTLERAGMYSPTRLLKVDY